MGLTAEQRAERNRGLFQKEIDTLFQNNKLVKALEVGVVQSWGRWQVSQEEADSVLAKYRVHLVFDSSYSEWTLEKLPEEHLVSVAYQPPKEIAVPQIPRAEHPGPKPNGDGMPPGYDIQNAHVEA